MPLEKPKKPTELVPRAFGGIKNNFSDDLQSTGFEPNIPQTYNGDNLNYHLDATGKELDYVEKVVDFINQAPVKHAVFVNENNQLDYIDTDSLVAQAEQKANTSLDNITPVAKETIANILIPDYSRKITTNALTYTAPKDGWIYVNAQNAEITVKINNVQQEFVRSSISTSYNASVNFSYLVSKGDVIAVSANATEIANPTITYYPLKGAY